MSFVQYAPGELLARALNAKPLSEDPTPLDLVIYIEYIVNHTHGNQDLVALHFDLLQGKLFFGKLWQDDMAVYFAEAADGTTVFYATRTEEGIKVEVMRSGKWSQVIEHAYDKVRSGLTDPEDWLGEYPPIGVHYVEHKAAPAGV